MLASLGCQLRPSHYCGSCCPVVSLQAKSSADIIRSLLVFKACGIKPLVRHADTLLRLSKRVLGSTLTNAVLGPTFYKQFVAGADAHSIQPTLAHLRRSGIRAILDYAAEDDVQEEAGHKKQQQAGKQDGQQQQDPLVVQVREPSTGGWVGGCTRGGTQRQYGYGLHGWGQAAGRCVWLGGTWGPT